MWYVQILHLSFIFNVCTLSSNISDVCSCAWPSPWGFTRDGGGGNSAKVLHNIDQLAISEQSSTSERGHERSGWQEVWRIVSCVVSQPDKKFPCWEVTGSTDVHAAYVFLKRSTLTPRVFFQSDFCFCIISNSRHAQIRGKKIADSNYSLLPTWATDCTNLHANDRIYIPGE